jgi:hypothetical protein
MPSPSSQTSHCEAISGNFCQISCVIVRNNDSSKRRSTELVNQATRSNALCYYKSNSLNPTCSTRALIKQCSVRKPGPLGNKMLPDMPPDDLALQTLRHVGSRCDSETSWVSVAPHPKHCSRPVFAGSSCC